MKKNNNIIEELYEKMTNIHGDEYGYNFASFVGKRKKMEMFCKKHGAFMQTPEVHLMGCGCPECGKEKSALSRRLTREKMVECGRNLYGDKYIYDLVEIKNAKEKVKIICPIHGEFLQTPDAHMHGHGCPECSGCKRVTEDEFIRRAKEVHGESYIYDNVSFSSMRKKVEIICPKHGVFEQTPKAHIEGAGCPRCANNVKLTRDEFIDRCHDIWGEIYYYESVIYKNATEKVEIICPEHGSFFQTPNSHLSGHGCPECANKCNIQENRLYEYVVKNLDSEAKKHYRPEFIGLQHLDIYSPKYNVAIEYQGKQHFEPVKRFGGEEHYKITCERDKRKYEICNENSLKVFYFSKERKTPNTYFSKIYTDYNNLIEDIKNEYNNR